MADVLRLGFHMVNLRRHHPGETYVLATDYDAIETRLAEADQIAHDVRVENAALQARLAEAEDELWRKDAILKAEVMRLAEAEKWRDYYRAKWLGDRAVPQPEPPEQADSAARHGAVPSDWDF